MVLRIDRGGVKNCFNENAFAAMSVAQTPYI